MNFNGVAIVINSCTRIQPGDNYLSFFCAKVNYFWDVIVNFYDR